jgi:TolB-like protein/Flp pilus assembly protein TadD
LPDSEGDRLSRYCPSPTCRATLSKYFADGLAEDILTRLAMWRWLPVIARNSSFAYRGRLVDIREIGRSLGARYVLEGSVRKAGGRVRVTGQLIDTVSGHHLWAQRYERILDDLFVLQDELTDHIVGALEAVVGHAVIERARVAPPGSLDAWDLHARGWWHLHRYTREDFAVAESLLQRALQIDPGLAMAHSGLALVQVWRVFSLWADDPQRAVSQAMDSARAALAADPLDSMAHAIMAMALVYARRHDEAHDASRKAIELNPSNAFAYGVIGWVHLYRGDSGPGIPAIETALRLSPNDWATRKWIATLSACHYVARDYVRAAEVAQVGVQREPNYPVAWRVLAIALGQLGRTSEARAAMSRFLELMPSFTTEQKARTLNPHRDEADTEHWLEGLRKAGWQG